MQDLPEPRHEHMFAYSNKVMRVLRRGSCLSRTTPFPGSIAP
jgi:hypothetical protein